ncbi:hypothetical protein SCLCIDRAFT_1217745 [Scleroderma citrinum Foug A]|uniref:Uncharacterized protein n=1 Tax=Scleroderma citrinum Foug A TaxID=1036808 RepID=A0A0C3DFA6_9AGAM|nr:hypothetical protein SCLCIDRAFT_1217745 [Scleroderma citrinum Foug A]
MLNTSPLPTGIYKITAKTGPVGAGSCGNRVVVKDASDFFIRQHQTGPGGGIYSLYVHHEQVFSEAGNIVIEEKSITNEWVITARGGNIYTIARKEDNPRAWTDPEGPRSCEHQLHLTELTGYITDQQKFRIVPA